MTNKKGEAMQIKKYSGDLLIGLYKRQIHELHGVSVRLVDLLEALYDQLELCLIEYEGLGGHPIKEIQKIKYTAEPLAKILNDYKHELNRINTNLTDQIDTTSDYIGKLQTKINAPWDKAPTADDSEQ